MADVRGVDEIIKLLKKVDSIATKSITKAAKVGATIALKDARANATELTGAQKKGIKLKLEKSSARGKKVYQMGFFGKDGKGSEFVKISKKGKRSFYPASQEYGWVDEKGRKHPGKRFMRNAIDNNREKINSEILETLGKEIDKVR